MSRIQLTTRTMGNAPLAHQSCGTLRHTTQRAARRRATPSPVWTRVEMAAIVR